jgi:misshapen/NIK-related kinase
MQLLLCYDNEGVYVNTMGRVSKNIVLQWGEMPTSVAYIGTGQIMGWGNKAIEVTSKCHLWLVKIIICNNISLTF